MSYHNWPSVQNGQSQYPPFNPSTASYASGISQTSSSGPIDAAVTSTATTYHLDPEHDIDGTGGMIGLTLEQYKSGQRASSAPSIPSATPVSNKRQLSHDDQMISSPSSQSGETSGNHQTQPKKRARKGPKGKLTPATTRSRVSILGESVFSPEDFAAGLEHFKKISTGQFLDDDDLDKMREFLTWGDDEQRKWLSNLSPEQFGVVLFAEKQDRDNQQSMVAQPNKGHVSQPQNDGASSFGSQLQQVNGVQHFAQDQHVQNLMALNNLSSFNQQFSSPVQNANFQQMSFQNTHGQSAQFGTHIPTFIVCPSGQLIPQQQNMFGNMSSMPSYQSSNMQIPGAYQQQIMVNGQLMNVSLQPAIGGHQAGQFNSHQLMSGAHGYSPQQHGTNASHTFNSMGQQDRTSSYSLPPGGQSNNANQGANYVLPALSHAARVAEAQLRAATMRRQHDELRARGLPVPNPPNHPKVPPLVMSGPGLGNLSGAINNLPPAPRSYLLNACEGINWEKDSEKDVTTKGAMVSPPNNSLSGHTPIGDGFPMKFADVSVGNPVFLSQMGSATMVNLAGRSTGNSASTTTSGAVIHHGVNGPAVPSYQVQLPNSAGQLSLGPNAQGSTFPAGAAKGTTSKTSPKSKKTTKKNPMAASSSAVSSVSNALFPSSLSGTSTSQTIIGTAQPNTSVSIVQNPGYSHGSQTNPISLDMPAPVSAITRSAAKSFAAKSAFPPLPSPELSPLANTSLSRVEPSACQASVTAPAQTAEPIIPSLGFSETNMAVTSTSSELGAADGSLSTHAPESTDEATYGSVSTESGFNISEFDELFASIATPELEPSTPNGPPTPEDSQPTDFGNDSLDGVFDFLDTPGVASSGEYVGVGIYDETQPDGLGFDMSGDQFDPMAGTDFTNMDFVSMGFGDWDDFDSTQ